MIDTNDVKQAATGRWRWILESLAPSLEAALAKPGKHVACPVHGGKDGFRLFNKDLDEKGGGVCNTCGAFPDGFAVLMWANYWNFVETKSAVAELLGIGDNKRTGRARSPVAPPPQHQVPAAKDPRENEKLRARLRRIWRDTAPLGDTIGTPVLEYLRGRGLKMKTSPMDLRAHPGLDYFHDGKKIGEFPAMVAIVRDPNGVPVTLHTTYLTLQGEKAPVPSIKKLQPYPDDRSLKGAAIRLAKPGDVLGEAEGIETALAVMEATGMPVWSAVNAALLANTEPPATVRRLYLWGDRDLKGAGRAAVDKALDRLSASGIAVVGILPPAEMYDGVSKSLDWLDVYREAPEVIRVSDKLRREMLKRTRILATRSAFTGQGQ
ncbi:MAG: DUF7146 domain-containing protein [Acidiferrobacterales bacterium]